MFLVIYHKPFELQKRALPFRNGFFIINDFLKRQKAQKPIFMANTA